MGNGQIMVSKKEKGVLEHKREVISSWEKTIARMEEVFRGVKYPWQISNAWTIETELRSWEQVSRGLNISDGNVAYTAQDKVNIANLKKRMMKLIELIQSVYNYSGEITVQQEEVFAELIKQMERAKKEENFNASFQDKKTIKVTENGKTVMKSYSEIIPGGPLLYNAEKVREEYYALCGPNPGNARELFIKLYCRTFKCPKTDAEKAYNTCMGYISRAERLKRYQGSVPTEEETALGVEINTKVKKKLVILTAEIKPSIIGTTSFRQEVMDSEVGVL